MIANKTPSEIIIIVAMQLAYQAKQLNRESV
jgi:hypothetical protein